MSVNLSKNNQNNSVSASEMADMYEMGQNAKLNHDIKVMSIRHDMEEYWLDYKNSVYHQECKYQNYNWDAMYDEDAYCTDKNYIPNLKSDLKKVCNCPNHKHIHNDKKFKTTHIN